MIDRHWTAFAVNSCVSYGIDHFLLAPGSRCTPLTLAVADHRNVQVVQHFDERALAFAALGYARGSGKPGVFICTSGTAVANAFPAVIEASMECVPLLLFTADRPPELRGTGANQTINQQRMFGEYVRRFTDMPVPNERIDGQPGLDVVHTELMCAFAASKSGPVHLNWMFREPFGLGSQPKMTVSHKAGVAIPANKIPVLKDTQDGTTINVAGNTLIIAGGCRREEAQTIRRWADEIGVPVIGDVTSGIRRISPEAAGGAYGMASELPEPDTILHVGQRIVSKSWLTYTSTLKKTRFIHLTSQDVQFNPNRLSVERILASITDSQLQLAEHSTSPSFRDAWLNAEERRREAIENVLSIGADQLSEPHLAFELARNMRDGQGLFVGNSTPIRDLDWFGNWPDELDVMVAANRGASGIDGLIASGVGFALGTGRPTTVVLGDLSALHDLNSLSLVAKANLPIVLIVINNRGGGIFDMLPVAKKSPHFESFFTTPHTIEFEAVAEMFGIPYRRIDTVPTFISAIRNATADGGSQLIEAHTDRRYNTIVRERIKRELGH